MKILHFADLHLGVENYGRIDPQTGLSSRLGDFLSAFDEVVAYALSEKIDLVLFCGDAYKSREPSQTHQREFARRIWRLASSGTPIFLLIGNHDLPNAIGRATTMEIFHTLEIENVTVATRPGTYRIETKNGILQVVALPWARRSALLSREETKNLTLDEVNERLERILTERLMAEVEALDRSLPAILAAHVFVHGARTGSERGMIMGHDYVLLQSNVANPAFDYVALGHIHKSQVLTENPPVVYPGSLERIDFSEEEDEKGFYVVEIGQKRQVSFEFHPVKARPFLTIKVNIGAQEPEPTEAVLKAIARHEVKDAIVRVQVAIPERLEGLFGEGEVRKALKDAHFIAAIARDVARERRPRMPGFSAEGTTPLEALEVYLNSKSISQERIKVLLEYGERLIGESEAE
ncbi:MAG: exonuclease subunit SbcD [Dehalococcoidia bacterium]|nr:exonuclease subunit SbcD [Dehalococcoidia bacterium]